uniref:Gustatory receptor n=1 Tax=Diabrotica virgifera virgifera TaxID=50390 RepID=A0A6P7FW33_DIAVI
MLSMIADQVAAFFITLTVLTAVIDTTLIYPSKTALIRTKIVTFENLLSSERGLKFLKYYMVGSIVIVPFVIIFDIYAWTQMGGTWDFAKYYLQKEFQYYQVTFGSFLWIWLGNEIYERFRLLNNKILRIFESTNRNTNFMDMKNKLYLQIHVEKDLKHFAQIYHDLCDTVELVNDVFGLCLVFYIMFIIAYVVSYVLYLLYIITGKEQHFDGSFEMFMIMSGCFWLMENFIKIMALASAGENLSREANRTITVCYGIINTLDNNPQYNVDAIKEELNFLIQQAAHRKPCLSASGFFVANSTMMGFIIGSITSYVIVAVQFLKETSP